MCMLNQDIAKNFLNTKSIKEKYNVRFETFISLIEKTEIFFFKVFSKSNTITKNG